MKKLIVSLAILAIASLSANAQFRVEVGANFANYKFEDTKMDSKFAPRATVYYTFIDGQGFGFEAGLGFVQNKIENSTTKSTMTISNIQLPIRAIYSYDFTNNFGMFGALGLYGGYAVAGKTVLGDTITTDPFEGEGGLKKFDFGTADGVYLKFMNKFTIGVELQDSFRNLCKAKEVDVQYTSVSVTLGYIF